MERNKNRTVASFTIYREDEIEKRTPEYRRIIFDTVALLASLVLVTALLRFGYYRFMRAAYPIEYEEIVTAYTDQFDFEPSLVYALIHTESGFDPDAVSPANAIGLMQITRETFEWARSRSKEKESLQVDDLYNPDVNIHYGVFVLSMLREEFTDTQTMLAAYNAGIGNVRRWLKDKNYSDDGVTLKFIPYKETRNYVKKIPKAKAYYETLYDLK